MGPEAFVQASTQALLEARDFGRASRCCKELAEGHKNRRGGGSAARRGSLDGSSAAAPPVSLEEEEEEKARRQAEKDLAFQEQSVSCWKQRQNPKALAGLET